MFWSGLKRKSDRVRKRLIWQKLSQKKPKRQKTAKRQESEVLKSPEFNTKVPFVILE